MDTRIKQSIRHGRYVVGASPEQRILFSAAVVVSAVTATSRAQELPVLGVTAAHDPSNITLQGSNYFYYVTGQGIVARQSTDGTNWTNGTPVFATQPAWTTTAVPGFTGFFWAPAVAFRNSQYYLYYAVSTFGSRLSGIGVATSPTLNPTDSNYAWTDHGPVVQSGNAGNSATWNAIDPSILQDTVSGNMYMSFGSYSTGIYLAQLDNTTGLIKSGTTQTQLASNRSGYKDYYGNTDPYGNGVEASYLMQHDGYYYLFDNWGGCCSGVSSTYNIRVGRSTSVNGPFVDQNGVALTSGGGSLFMGNSGNEIGPGQFSFFNFNGQDEFGYHYYDGNSNGAPTEGIRDLYWTATDWPTIAPVNPNWNGNTNGNWSTAGNWADSVWNTGLVPNAAGTIANFVTTSAGQHTVTLDGGAKTIGTLNLNSGIGFTIGSATGNGLILDTGNTNVVNINDQLGNHTVAAPITAKESLAVDISYTTNTLTLGAVSGSTLNKYGFGTLSLSGTNIYNANIFVRSGTLDVTGPVSVTSFTSVGVSAGDVGTLNVRLTGSYTSAYDLNIGDTGYGGVAAGTLNLSGSAVVIITTGGGFYVGSGFSAGTEAEGIVNQTGGTLTASGTTDGGFTVGGRGSNQATGVYNLQAGTVNANTNVFDGGYGSGTINQSGGSFQANVFASIGRYAGATGVWNISAGVFNQTKSADSLIVGEGGSGLLNISGTGQVTTASALILGKSGGAGTLNLLGGSLVTTAIQKGTGSANFNFSGGTVKAAGSNTAFIPVGPIATVQSGGAILDSNGFNITVADPLTHDSTLGTTTDGGLNKLGLGTLTLSGLDTYSGPTIINAGTLSVASTGGIASSKSISVLGSGTLSASGSSNDGLSSAAAISVIGTLILGAGSLGTGIKPITLATLSLNANSVVEVVNPPSHTDRRVLVVTNGLSFQTLNGNLSGRLDLAGNDLIVKTGSVGDLTSQVQAGFNSGGSIWNGSAGIVSTTAAADTGHLTAVGIIQNSVDGTTTGAALYGSAGSLGLFDNQSPSNADVLAKYTYFGDANLDGKVDGSDYSRIDSGFLAGATGWFNGDFNYDGVVNGSDYTLIDNAYNIQAAPLTAEVESPTVQITDEPAVASVPEPASIGLMMLGAGSSLIRRRRRTS